jgi:hypothetical protein
MRLSASEIHRTRRAELMRLESLMLVALREREFTSVLSKNTSKKSYNIKGRQVAGPEALCIPGNRYNIESVVGCKFSVSAAAGCAEEMKRALSRA